ncbi:hypothetical protein SOVF_215870 [Spinacia oleracea]|nr:hypothetical protein SOVF_215870 [Spinacia oleracea]
MNGVLFHEVEDKPQRRNHWCQLFHLICNWGGTVIDGEEEREHSLDCNRANANTSNSKSNSNRPARERVCANRTSLVIRLILVFNLVIAG